MSRAVRVLPYGGFTVRTGLSERSRGVIPSAGGKHLLWVKTYSLCRVLTSIQIAVSTVKDDLVLPSWYRLGFKMVYEMGMGLRTWSKSCPQCAV
jgi:hypothetical protein